MFLFQLSSYDSPSLDAEAEELLCRRLESYSRRAAPGLWKITDRLTTCAGKPPKRRRTRYRGILLIALGVFALIPGLAEPKNSALIWAGTVAVLVGFFELSLSRREKAPKIPASCRREAKTLLERYRSVDWSQAQVSVRFDKTGMTMSSGKSRDTVPYENVNSVFESEHLWLLVYQGEKALLLQKKDLTSGESGEFSSNLLQKIGTKN